MKYRKKPVVIEAEQWLPCRSQDEWDVEEMPYPPAPHELLRRRWWSRRWQLKTLEGWFKLTPYDWIITGVENERYPCKPSVFEATYEKV